MVEGDRGYLTKVKDFRSLRSAAMFVRDMPEHYRFVEIRGLDIAPLDGLEKLAFENFTDGKVRLD